MKNRKRLLLIVLMTAIAITAFAQQYDPERDFGAEPIDGGKSVRITSYRGDEWTIRIPPSIRGLPVTTIGDRAFKELTSIISVTIPNSITNIGIEAFSGCTNLVNVTIPDSVINIGVVAFENTAWLDNQPNGLVYAGKVAYCYKGTMPANTRIILADGTKGVAAGAFYESTGLASITIPSSVTSIGEGAFFGCTSLTTINVATSNNFYSTENGVLYNKNKSILHTYPSGKAGNSFTIPNSVTNIAMYAFVFCYLTSITIPSNVTSIGGLAFWGEGPNYHLTSVTFQGVIAKNNLGSTIDGVFIPAFMGDLQEKYLEKGIGRYTLNTQSGVWTKQ